MSSSIDFAHVDVANRALALVRGQPLKSFDDEDARTRQVISVYWTEIDALLSARTWHFCHGLHRLAQAATDVDTRGWLYAHVLPADRIGAPHLIYTDPATGAVLDAYELTARHILADESLIYARVPVRVDPNNWPGYFRKLAVTAVAASLAASVRGDDSLAAMLRAEAYGTPSQIGQGGLLKVASDLDHAIRPPEILPSGDSYVAERTIPVPGERYLRF